MIIKYKNHESYIRNCNRFLFSALTKLKDMENEGCAEILKYNRIFFRHKIRMYLVILNSRETIPYSQLDEERKKYRAKLKILGSIEDE